MADKDVLDEQVDGGDDPEMNQAGDEVETAEAEPSHEENEAEPSREEKLKEAIDVQVEEVGALRKKLTITLPREAIDEQFDDQYGELRHEAQVPGFRKGRAPRRLLEKRFGSEVSETLVQQFVSSGYLAATEKMDLKVIGDPMIWATEKGADSETLVDVQKAIDLIKIPDAGPLVFSCEVETRPEFELPEIEGIPLEKPTLEVTDDDVNRQVDRFREMAGTYEKVPEGPVEADDRVIADVMMRSGDTVLKEEGNVSLAARPQMVDGVSLEKLGEVLIGAKPGDVCPISGDIPDTYVKAEFRGKQADFEFKIHEIQRLTVPDLDEQLVKKFGFGNEKELRDWVRSDMESRLGEQVRLAMSDQVYAYLLDKTSLELPERLSEQQINQVVLRRMLDLYKQGVPPAETEKRMDELKTSAREDTLRDLKIAFIMEKLAEECEVDVSEGEVNAQIAAIAQRQGRRFDRVRDELAKQGAIANLYVRIRDGKIIDQLIAKAKVSEPASKSEPKKSAPPADKEGEGAGAEAGEGEDEPAASTRSKPKRTPPDKGSDSTSDEFADET